MEEERTEDHNKADSSKPTGLPINWSLISQPVLPTTSMGAALPPPQSSSGHSLKNKVKSFTQRRMRARDREKDRERLEVEVLVSSPGEQVLSGLTPQRQRPLGKSLPGSSWRTHAVKNLYSSDEDDEVEVEVKLEIHSPPAEAKVEKELREVLDAEVKEEEMKEESTEPAEVRDNTSRERLQSDTSSSSKDEQSNPPATPLSASSSTTSSSSTTAAASNTIARHWAPPKGFWRVARPETLLLNGVSLQSMPMKDLTQIGEQSEVQRKTKTADTTGADGGLAEDGEASSRIKRLDSLEGYLDKRTESDMIKPAKSVENTSDVDSAEEKLTVKQRAYAKLRERQQICKELREQSGRKNVENYGEEREEGEGPQGVYHNPDPAILLELEPYLRTLLLTTDELPLSPRHEQAKRLLERARLKARSNHVKDDRVTRRSHSDQRSPLTKQQVEASEVSTVQKVPQVKDDLTAQTTAGPLLVPDQRETSPNDLASRPRRYGCSPTRVRFEDESEKEAESRYLDRMRQRGRPGFPKSKQKESNTDSSSSGSEKSRTNRSISVPASQKLDDVSSVGQVTTVIKEIIVVVKKCEACGSVVREPQTISVGPDIQNIDAQLTSNHEDPRGKPVPRWVPPNKPEVSTRPKAPLTVTFAGAYVLGESKETSTGWKSSGFGKLRRRSRKGESRLESGHGPYGPSWAQRRNSNPRNRGSSSRAVSFAPDSPVTLEPRLLGASSGQRESPTPALPIKSALKSSSRNRTATIQSTVQFQKSASQGAENAQHAGLLDSPEALSQGSPSTNNQLACIRPSTLRYSPARLTTDVPTTEVWDATPDGAVGGDPVSGSDCRPALRGIALSRTDDLRAELLRAEHLKAEALWEENCDGSRKLDGRSKPFLRRFFSSIGLNSVGRLVKGARSSSMEQLSLPAPPRVSSASPSPTRRPHPTIRIQRTPSLQTLNTVLPLAQLRKASSVQSLERRTERTTILGEVQIPYGLAPSPDSPQLELHRALSVEEILTTRMVLPVGRVTQVFPDGTLLLELIRPPNGPFGFVISRGKGRPDTGVYVEKVGDGSGESPYVGLLGNGDEILQVNGEAVAGLSLEQVTWLMTRESVATLRIMPARRNQR
ncbi:uncharacterized protein ACB058_015814 isoform 1-T2 [Synchiropus picturatus]